jgi:hypothetical protein
MKQSASFSGKEIESTSLNFSELRDKGLDFIQKLSGDIWTDYNSHDPGVTILEQICYALTDIAYRTSLPVEDLLMPEKGLQLDPRNNAFFTPSSILSSHPVTINDLRKMIIDEFDEIQNVWIYTKENSGYEEQLLGINQIEILPKLNFIDIVKANPKRRVEFLKKINQFLSENRNLGEIYGKVRLLEPQKINICFDIYLNEQTDLELTIANLFLKLLEFIYSRIQYSSFNEMKEVGYSLEETFAGPRLKNGFIKDDSLKNRVKAIHINELQKLLLKVDGITKCIVKPFIIDGVEYKSLDAENEKFFHLLIDDHSKDTMDNRFDSMYENMTVFINHKELSILNKHKINSLFSEIWSKKHRGYRIGKSLNELFYNKLKGTYRNPEEYHSIQRHFPIIYGIGEEGLSQNEPIERRAKALQLKTYLMLFEQHLANHLSQLGNLNEFFNIDLDKDQGKTYYTQWMYSIPDMDKLAEENIPANESYIESTKLFLNRKNRIYNHLLARFGEDLNDIPWKVALRLNLLRNEEEFNQILVQKKSDFLLHLKKFSYNRMKGESFLPANPKISNQKFVRKPSGLEQMILAKTGIPDRKNKSLIPDFEAMKLHLHKLKEDPLSDKEELNLKFRPLRSNEIYNSYQTGHSSELPNALYGTIGLKALFKETLNYNNYRLSVRKSDSDKVQVIFQKERNVWVSLFECSDEEKAVQNIHQLIDYFIDQNSQSEGIYIVDHILLSDLLLESECGFSFYDEYGRLQFHTSEKELWWNSVEYRDERLKKLYRFGVIKAAYSYSNGEWNINDDEGNILATYVADIRYSPISKAELYKQTKSIIQLFDYSENVDGRLRFDEMEKIRKMGSIQDKKITYEQRRLVFQRRLTNGKIIDEDFFNLKISVLMPDWPARFQVERFKDYVTDLIHERIPAHIENEIFWVNAHDLKAFEKVYHKWEEVKSESKSSKAHLKRMKSASYEVYQKIMELKKNRS